VQPGAVATGRDFELFFADGNIWRMAQTPLTALKADLRANRGIFRGQMAVTGYRLAQLARETLPGPVAKVLELVYAVLSLALLGIELPPAVQAGPGLRIYHTIGIVVNTETVLGSNVTIRQNTSLAQAHIGDDVDLGMGVLVVGPVTIGAGARIGAGAVVIRDVPAGATAVGNPARVLPDRTGSTEDA
jgi:serine acetyltransferase